MVRPLILVGDKTDHGGTVISGAPGSDAGGKAIARVGDKVTCPHKGHGGTTTIVSGDPTLMIDGMPAAREGDKTACGATLIAGQRVTTDGSGGGSGSGVRGAAAARSVGATSGPESESAYDQHFLVTNEATGEPLVDYPYVVTLASGVRIEGRTDLDGLTEKISSSEADTATLEVYEETPPLNPGWDR